MIYKLFANCYPIKGFFRSSILDVQNNTFDIIPNILFTFLQNRGVINTEKLIKKYGEHNSKIIAEYIDYLIEKNFIFECDYDELKCFSDINLAFSKPYQIQNSIIELNSNIENLKKHIQELINLNCPHIEIRFYEKVSFETLLKVVSCTENSLLRSIEIILPYNENYSENKIKQLCIDNLRINKLIFTSSPNDKILNDDNIARTIIFIKQKISSNNDCGFISPINFSCNLLMLSESQHYNTCLNRKICIDAEGNIKNCPAMTKSFGNIADTTMEDAINKPGFKDLWGFRKDDIDVCKDCEFRYMCSDCRCFIKNPQDIYSQPAKCCYNPYIAKWQGEEGYITVEQWRVQNPKWETKAKRKPLVKVPIKVE